MQDPLKKELLHIAATVPTRGHDIITFGVCVDTRMLHGALGARYWSLGVRYCRLLCALFGAVQGYLPAESIYDDPCLEHLL